MSPPIVDPEIPYNAEIPGGLQPGRLLRLQGVTNPDADRFNINLQTGPSSKPRDDTAMHISVRLNQGYIARNSYKNGSWEDEQGNGRLPIGQAQSWEILILVDQQDYKVAVNGQHFCEFPHRIPYSEVTHLLIDGDVSITLISWEGIVGVGSESASTFSELNAEAPQGGYAPPGTYGPPPGYGQPPPNYGYGVPPPPGAQQESGFNNFLEQAQGVLAGAIRSGAAEKLLSGFFSSGQPQQQQGYAHQNAKYGIYPDLPQDMDLNLKETQAKHQPGPVENLLANLLSGGNKQQQMSQTSTNPSQSQQIPQNQQPLDLSSLLSGLLNTKQQQTGTQNQTASNQQLNPQQNQSQNVDWGGLLGSLISAGNQQNTQGNMPPGQLAGAPSGQLPGAPPPRQGSNAQQNVQGSSQEQNVDWGALLGTLISGGNQQPTQQNLPQGPVPTGPPQNPSFNTQQNVGNPQSEGVDWGALLGGLISGGNQQTQSSVSHTQTPLQQTGQKGQDQSKGVDLNLLLSGLISAAAAQNATRPIQETGKPQPPTQNPPNTSQQHQGIDFGQVLTGLLSNISQPQQPTENKNIDNIPPRQPFGVVGPYQGGPGGGTSYGQMSGIPSANQAASGPPPAEPQPLPNMSTPAQGNIQKPSGTKRQSSQPATQEPIEDVSDKLAEVIAAENNSSQQNSAQSRQYGQYPHPQGNQGQGPVESLLSSFLGGGGGQTHHQQQPQFGGGESLGGLGSMSGLLQNFAGQILQPRDPNQRQNY